MHSNNDGQNKSALTIAVITSVDGTVRVYATL